MSCLDCFLGHVHEGQPRGKAVKLYGLDAYVSEPHEGRQVKGIIVVLSDAFGWEFANSRLLADRYANKGDFKVYIPDFYQGMPPLIMEDIGVVHKALRDLARLTPRFVKDAPLHCGYLNPSMDFSPWRNGTCRNYATYSG